MELVILKPSFVDRKDLAHTGELRSKVPRVGLKICFPLPTQHSPHLYLPLSAQRDTWQLLGLLG